MNERHGWYGASPPNDDEVAVPVYGEVVCAGIRYGNPGLDISVTELPTATPAMPGP